MITRWMIVAALVATAGPARADDAVTAAPWLCVPPRTGPFNECWKGNSLGENFVAECAARQAKRRRQPSRVRLDAGAWHEFSRTTWRCVPLAVDHRVRITVENYGRAYASWLFAATTPCRSGVFDLVGPNFYGAIYAKCSKRNPARDERLSGDAGP